MTETLENPNRESGEPVIDNEAAETGPAIRESTVFARARRVAATAYGRQRDAALFGRATVVCAPSRIVRVGLLGLGNVSQAVARLCCESADVLRRRGVELRVVAALVRDASRPRGFVPAGARITSDALEFFGHRFDVVIETLGGVEPAYRYVRSVLRSGVSVVTANKSLLAAHGEELERVAAAAGASLRCEAAAIAGVPFLNTLRERPLAASVRRVFGILNGTSNYVLTRLGATRQSFGEALAAAQQCGFAEPDPTSDISGRDAAEKLIVILQHLGLRGVRPGDIETRGINDLTSADLRQARSLGGVIKPVAFASLAGDGRVSAFVGPALLPLSDPLASVEREQNGIALEGPRIGRLFFSGPGAGPAITAGTILDDVAELIVADGRRRAAPARTPSTPFTVEAPETGWLIRFSLGRGTRFIAVTEFLESRGARVRNLGGSPPSGQGDLLYVTVEPCSRGELERVLGDFETSNGARAYAVRAMGDL